jgi:hypothetical protein
MARFPFNSSAGWSMRQHQGRSGRCWHQSDRSDPLCSLVSIRLDVTAPFGSRRPARSGMWIVAVIAFNLSELQRRRQASLSKSRSAAVAGFQTVLLLPTVTEFANRQGEIAQQRNRAGARMTNGYLS